MENLTLIYFEGCPNYSVAKELLKSSNLMFDEIDQGRLEENDPLAAFSSPTLLLKGNIVFGGKVGGAGCTVRIPSSNELEEKILELQGR